MFAGIRKHGLGRSRRVITFTVAGCNGSDQFISYAGIFTRRRQKSIVKVFLLLNSGLQSVISDRERSRLEVSRLCYEVDSLKAHLEEKAPGEKEFINQRFQDMGAKDDLLLSKAEIGNVFQEMTDLKKKMEQCVKSTTSCNVCCVQEIRNLP
jgi:hypothetical protein